MSFIVDYMRTSLRIINGNSHVVCYSFVHYLYSNNMVYENAIVIFSTLYSS